MLIMMPGHAASCLDTGKLSASSSVHSICFGSFIAVQHNSVSFCSCKTVYVIGTPVTLYCPSSELLTDAVAFSDTVAPSVQFQRSFQDASNATDDVDGLASILDDQEISFQKTNNNTLFVAESDVLGTGKVFGDAASFADAGSLRSQGFADFTYFAEDYVGAIEHRQHEIKRCAQARGVEAQRRAGRALDHGHHESHLRSRRVCRELFFDF